MKLRADAGPKQAIAAYCEMLFHNVLYSRSNASINCRLATVNGRFRPPLKVSSPIEI